MATPTTLPVSTDAVVRLMNDLRIAAELSLSRVETYAKDHTAELAKVVVAYRSTVADTGPRLIRTQVAVTQALAAKPGDPGLLALLKRTIELLTVWTAHAKGYAAYERPATEAEKGTAVRIGVAPAVVIAIAIGAAVIAVSITGVAWAVVHYKEAQTLSDEVALIEKDPSLAAAIAKLNQTAPNSPLPDPTNPNSGAGWLWVLGAFGLAGAAFFFLPKLGK